MNDIEKTADTFESILALFREAERQRAESEARFEREMARSIVEVKFKAHENDLPKVLK